VAASGTMPNRPPFSTLRELARKRTKVETCEMCSAEVAAEHQHLIDPAIRKLICACDACAILFSGQSSAKYKRVPRDVRFLRDFQMSDAQWDNLMIPIEMAFIFRSSPNNRPVAFYPSPAGATESLLSLETWNDVENENPSLKKMQGDVEALLVNRVGAARGVQPEFYIAPIDECYKLVGLIRMHWRGLSGGTEVWREVAQFFAELRIKAGASPEESRA
jgi:hypothetical protein